MWRCPQHRAAAVSGRSAAAALIATVSVLAGCEEVSHERIDTWMTTQKGFGKIEKTLRAPELAADLRAHAAQNLVRMDRPEVCLGALADMAPPERGPVMTVLLPRLWEDARVSGDLTMPSPIQVAAKDALFELRALADEPGRETIDAYLIEWLTGGYYAARARSGRFSGATVVRALGARSAPHLIRVARSLLTPPPGEKGTQYQLEDPLLIGLAASGSAEAVGFLLDLLTMEHNDKRLPERVMDALYKGYVANQELFAPAEPAALVPHLDQLVHVAQHHRGRVANDAIRLIRAVGSPGCIAPLVELITAAPESSELLWVSAAAALQCGKARALLPVADALPRHRGYALQEIERAFVEPVIALDDRAAAVREARVLLTSESWITRAVGIELLDRLADPASAAESAEAARKLTRDRTPLKGWWGEQRGLPRQGRKKVPVLGERAKEVAKKLDRLSKSS